MNVGLVGNRRYRPLADLLAKFSAEAERLGVKLYPEPSLADLLPGPAGMLDAHSVEIIVSLGGDGTLLRGARESCTRGIPIVGINLGHLGFLSAAGPDMAVEALTRISRKLYRVEERRALSVRIGDGAAALAVNDAVVHKGGVARVIRMSVTVDGEPVGTYSADGIIVSTATGSTAYSMSAGGPIVVPGVDAFVITPICPHTLAVRPLVVPATSIIALRVLDPVPRPEDLLVSLDGQSTGTLSTHQDVTVVSAQAPVLLAQITEESFYKRLTRKLAWGDLAERTY